MGLQKLRFIPPLPGFNLADYKQEPRRLLANVIADNTQLTIEGVITELRFQDHTSSLQVAEMLKGSTSLNDLITVLNKTTTKLQVDSLIHAVCCAADPSFEDYFAGISNLPGSGNLMTTGIII